MSLRWSILILADYGRVVYFTGAPTGDLSPKRLWRWSQNAIGTVLEAPWLDLPQLSSRT